MRSPWDSQPARARANRSSTLALLSVPEEGPYLPGAALGWYASARALCSSLLFHAGDACALVEHLCQPSPSLQPRFPISCPPLGG